jgi:hypothetical protein
MILKVHRRGDEEEGNHSHNYATEEDKKEYRANPRQSPQHGLAAFP